MFNVEKQDIIVTPKIDLIRISIDKQENSVKTKNKFFNKLNSITVSKSKPKKEYKQGYNHSRDYFVSINNQVFKCVLAECMYDHYMPYLLTVHDPEKEAVVSLEKEFAQLDKYNLNKVEYVLDFNHTNNDRMYEFLKRTVVLAWRGKPLHLNYDTTTYLNNNYTAWSRAGKIYQKEVAADDGIEQKVTRLEVTHKNNYLFKNKMRRCNDTFNTKLIDVFKHISFKVFNSNLFTNKLLELGKDKLFIANKLHEFESDIKKGLLADVNLEAKKYCMNKTYLKEHSFNKHFRTLLPNTNFWDSNSFLLNSDMMG